MPATTCSVVSPIDRRLPTSSPRPPPSPASSRLGLFAVMNNPGPKRPSSNPSLSRKLPPLVRDRSYPGPVPGPSTVVAGRSMHQIQLEMEYDAEESDHDDDSGPSIHGWPGGMERLAAALPDDTASPAIREIHALCVFDAVTLPPSARPSSPLIDALLREPVVRRWGRWRWCAQPAFTEVHVAEAVLMYERGVEQPTAGRCNRCRAGQCISPQCVVLPVVIRNQMQQQNEPGPCSNCVHDGVGYACNAGRKPTPPRVGSKSPEPAARDPGQVVDHLAVLEMIAELKTPSGSRRDDSLAGRAKRIEVAALRISQAAREWGDRVAMS